MVEEKSQSGVEVKGDRDHWVVLMNHRNRSAAFLLAAGALALQMWGGGYPVWLWGAMLVYFLLGPHVMFWRARRSRVPLDAETKHTFVDALSFGLWSGLLGFPIWITFIFFVGSTMNPAAFRGKRGVAQGVSLFVAGALVGAGMQGFELNLETGPSATALSIAGIIVYLMTFGLGVHDRSVKLAEARSALKDRESELEDQLRQNIDLQTRLKEQASRDPLTGLFNRRYLMKELARLIERSDESGYPIAMIIADVDHFKRINDTHGHPVGDAVLTRLARVFEARTEGAGFCARFGGEEFVVVLRGVELDEAFGVAEEIRESWSEVVVRAGDVDVRSTLSLGVAAAPAHGDEPEAIIRVADAALYAAKEGGRNRTRVARA